MAAAYCLSVWISDEFNNPFDIPGHAQALCIDQQYMGPRPDRWLLRNMA